MITRNLTFVKEITYSSNSTSHKHIEYECHTIALKVVDYSDPDATPEWTLVGRPLVTSIVYVYVLFTCSQSFFPLLSLSHLPLLFTSLYPKPPIFCI